ncbi:ComF family protein [Pelagibius sp. Alg239-R121]|uniref:ComF family protein n=1 Tax=Pelagibius sp. Alg239-R121 TaxID=2993448 RepID=UPI0024A747D6|nr:ComF family protein [Pelagibius sp. Alg239-R121]
MPARGMLAHMQTVTMIARRALDAVLPPTCAKCRVVVERNGTVCADCWKDLRFLAPPWCHSCGFPFEFEGAETVSQGRGNADAPLCADCLHKPKSFDRARAALGYDDASRALILAFKHADRTETAMTLANWMALAGGDLLAAADVVVPVPLHWRRLFLRRYNQSALLAQKLAQSRGIAFHALVLERRRATRPQGHLSGTARHRNVAGAFRVRPSQRGQIEGRRVLLVDDVYTTGATIAACVASLRAGGAAAVDVLTLARVLRT